MGEGLGVVHGRRVLYTLSELYHELLVFVSQQSDYKTLLCILLESAA